MARSGLETGFLLDDAGRVMEAVTETLDEGNELVSVTTKVLRERLEANHP